MKTMTDVEPIVDDSPDLDITAGHALNDFDQGVEPAVPDQSEAWGNIFGTLASIEEQPEFEPFQVAGIGSSLGGMISRAIRSAGTATKKTAESVVTAAEKEAAEKATKAAVEAMPAKPKGVPPGAAETAVDIVTEAKAGKLPPAAPKAKYVETGSLNIERHHPGGSAQSLGKLVELTEGDPLAISRMAEQGGRTADNMNEVAKLMDIDIANKTHAELQAGVEADPFKGYLEHLTGKRAGLMDEEAQLSARTILSSLASGADEVLVRIAGGDHTPETIARALAYQEKMAVMQAIVTQNASKLGAALNQQKIIIGAMRSDSLKALDSAVMQGGGVETMVLKAQAYAAEKAKGVPPPQAMKKAMEKSTWFEAWIEFYKSNMLSSVQTQEINLFSSLAYNTYRHIAVIPTAAVVGAVRGAFGAADRVYASEVAHHWVGGLTGAMDGVRNAIDVILKNESTMESMSRNFDRGAKYDMREALAPLMKEKFGETGETVARYATLPYRLMRGGDEITRTMAYRAELAGLAARDAAVKGLEGDDFTRHVDSIMDNPTGPYAELHQKALAVSKEQAFQDTELGGGIVGAVARHVRQAAAEHPSLSIIMPFITTPSNIAVTILENSPLAPFTARWRVQFAAGGAERDIAIAKMTLGTAAVLPLYMMHDAGIITGKGPDSPEQRAALERTGWKPYSVKVGDSFYTYNRLEPLAGLVASVADALDSAKYTREKHDAAMMILDAGIAFGEHIMDSTMLQSLKKFMDVFTLGPTTGIPKLVGQTGENMFIPYSSLVAATARAREVAMGEGVKMPPPIPKPGFAGFNTIGDMVQSAWATAATRLPGARENLIPKRYWDGEVVMPGQGWAASLIAPVPWQPFKKDAASAALIAHGVSVRDVSPLLTVGRVTVNLVDMDRGVGQIYDLYAKTVGEKRREAVMEVIDDPDYKEASKGPGGERSLALTRALSAGLDAGKAEFLEKFREQVEKSPEKFTAFAQSIGMDYETFIEQARGAEIEAKATARFVARGTPKSKPISPPGF